MVWAGVGVSVILFSAMYRLSAHVLEFFYLPTLSVKDILLASIWTIFMAYSEGYKGFQKGFSPRVAARTKYLFDQPSIINSVFAPFFVMGFFNSVKKRLITVWLLTSLIFILVMVVKYIPQPWRGIIDMGVLIGLAWGLLSFYYSLYLAFTQPSFNHSPEVSY